MLLLFIIILYFFSITNKMSTLRVFQEGWLKEEKSKV